MKLAVRWVPSLDGVFINDLHEPSARILEGPIQTHPEANPALEGSDPDPKQVLRGSDPSAMVALDETDWRAPLLAYLLEEVLPPKGTEARWIARRAKTFVALGDELYK